MTTVEPRSRRLRSLRQEHEKIKVKYEDRIKALEAASADSAEGARSLGSGKLHSGSGSHPGQYRTLPAALARVKELETEIERVRAFYTRKVRKYSQDFQIYTFEVIYSDYFRISVYCYRYYYIMMLLILLF